MKCNQDLIGKKAFVMYLFSKQYGQKILSDKNVYVIFLVKLICQILSKKQH